MVRITIEELREARDDCMRSTIENHVVVRDRYSALRDLYSQQEEEDKLIEFRNEVRVSDITIEVEND